jgi:uncharacterized protein
MPEVIVDTSPIQYLYQIAQLDLLATLYGRVKMPPAVVNELAEGCAQGVSLPDLTALSWITLCPVPASWLIPDIPNLGAGEREALSLAMMYSDALVILDDGLARSYAQGLQIRVTETLGVLLKGKQLGYLNAIAPELDRLDRLKFCLSAATRAVVLKLANE